MDFKNEFDKLINELDEFSNTPFGHYIFNFLIGIAIILLIGTGLYLGAAFVTWSLPSLAWFLSGSNSLYRIIVLVYAFVVYISTTEGVDDYPM
jgi:choline-glycine betaine transporter